MRTSIIAAGIALCAIGLTACGSAADTGGSPSSQATVRADGPAQVLQILRDAGLCSAPESEKAQPGSETAFSHPAMTICHDAKSPTQQTIVLIEGMQTASRDRMASQLAQQDVYAYVRADDDPWFLLVPAVQDKAARAAFGSQLRRLNSSLCAPPCGTVRHGDSSTDHVSGGVASLEPGS